MLSYKLSLSDFPKQYTPQRYKHIYLHLFVHLLSAAAAYLINFK